MENNKKIGDTSLARFTNAQEKCFEQVIAELSQGEKTTHWIWFVFPQIFGLGFSEYSKYYGIKDLTEADAYWRHPLLRARYEECLGLILNTQKSAQDILGQVDAQKLQSSITLFLEVDKTSELLLMAIEELYFGKKDSQTLLILADS
jgi:uncharacterized protein (DUF1810 family)